MEHAVTTSQPGFVTEIELQHAFQSLEAAAKARPVLGFQIDLRGKAADACLHMAKTFALQDYAFETHDSETWEIEEVVEDHDELAVSPNATSRKVTAQYDILFSPTYRVPVLYFTLESLPQDGPRGLDAVYEYLVHKDNSSRLRQVGIIGGISIANHPQSDVPCFFVHPCNTAEAMQHLINHSSVTPVQYLQLWMGLIGASVGLNLPIELAEVIE